jgi:hypothetical protein
VAAWRDRVGPGRVSVHHSHPDPVSLSPADLSVMWLGRSIGVVRALTPDGSDYRGEPRSDPTQWLRTYSKLILAAGSELRVQSRHRSLDVAYLAHHLANLEMARLGHIWYDTDGLHL